jgi:hypothetical protein
MIASMADKHRADFAQFLQQFKSFHANSSVRL